MQATKNNKMKIIAIFIAHKAVNSLEKFYLEFPKKLVDDIILVDDASGDGTYELAQRLGITSYENPINLGYGGNMKRTIKIALEHGADVIIDIHPDGEYKPSAIASAISEVKKGAKLVLGNRFTHPTAPLKTGMHFWKLIPILALNWIDKLALGINIGDFHQGFRVYTKELLEDVNFQNNSDSYLFSFELIAQTAFKKMKVSQVPVETSYTGKKRGASLKNSIKYSFGTFKVLLLFLMAKMGVSVKMFSSPKKFQKGRTFDF